MSSKPNPPATLTGSWITCLKACENANNMAMAYHPDHAYSGQSVMLTSAGYMARATGNLTGGYWLSDKGRKFLQRRREPVLTAKRVLTVDQPPRLPSRCRRGRNAISGFYDIQSFERVQRLRWLHLSRRARGRR